MVETPGIAPGSCIQLICFINYEERPIITRKGISTLGQTMWPTCYLYCSLIISDGQILVSLFIIESFQKGCLSEIRSARTTNSFSSSEYPMTFFPSLFSNINLYFSDRFFLGRLFFLIIFYSKHISNIFRQ